LTGEAKKQAAVFEGLVRVLDTVTKAELSRLATAAAGATSAANLAKTLGDEAGAMRATADAAGLLVRARQTEVDALERTIAVAKTELDTYAKGKQAKESEILKRQEALVVMQAELHAKDQLRTASRNEALAANLAAATYGDQSKQLAGLIATRDRLTQALRLQTKGSAEAIAMQQALAVVGHQVVDAASDEVKAIEAQIAAGKELRDLRRALTDTLASDADRLRTIRRRDMSEAQQQADIEKQVSEKIRAARLAQSQGDSARAKAIAEEAKGLAESLENNKKAQKLFKESASVYETAAAAEIAAAEEKRKAQAAADAAARSGADEQQKALAGLQVKLKELTGETTEIKVKVDISEAEANLRRIQEQINRLNTAGRAGGGALPGYALGGPVPGFAAGGHPITLRPGLIRGPGTGTSDSILARVSNGEHAFITKASRAKQLWPLLNALNFGSDALVDRVLSHLPGGLARAPVAASGGYASGGAVSAPVDTVNIHLTVGRSTVQLHGARDQANALAGALRELQRGL
jgi:hypothetical protein